MAIEYDREGQLVVRSREDDVLDETFRVFSQCQLYRNTTASHWEEIAELIWPTSRNTFFYGNYNWPGQKKTDRQVDATGMMALSRFAAIFDSLLTPRNMFWHQLSSSEPALNKDRAVKEWFSSATRILFQMRYAPIANFASQNSMNYTSLGALGNHCMFLDQAVDETGRPLREFRYKSVPMGEMFFIENHQGLVSAFVRWFRLTAEQAVVKWPDTCPQNIRDAAAKNSQAPFDFLHFVRPRHKDEYDPKAIGPASMKFASFYISIEGRCLLAEGGYRKLPIAPGRYEQTPGEVYGRGPASFVLPALKTLNAEKATFLKQGHRASDPVLLVNDDGVIDVSLRPGAIVKGGINADGKPLVGVLPTGNIQVNKEMMDEERSLINDAFLVSLFQILTETPTMTATEVIERTNEKGILIAPTAGRQQSEYLGPLIDRELDLASFLQALPPMPPALMEAKGAYDIVYTSPLSRAMRAQEAAGFMRTTETVKELVNVTGDQSLLDSLAFDRAIPDIADIQGSPIEWMATADEINLKRKARAQATQRQEQIQAAPAQAAMLKAGVAAHQAGLGGGGPQSPLQPGPAVPIPGSQGGQ